MIRKFFALFISLGSVACGTSQFSYQDAVSHVLQESSTIRLDHISSKLHQIKELSLVTHLPNRTKGTSKHRMINPGKLSKYDLFTITNDSTEFNFSYNFECYLPTVWEPNSSKTELQMIQGYDYKNAFDASTQYGWFSYRKFNEKVNQIFHVFNSHFQKEKEGKVYYEFQSPVDGYHDFPILGWIVERAPQIELHILIKNENALQILTVTYEG